MKYKVLFCALALLGVTVAADAHEYYLPGMTLIHPWAEPTAKGATSAAVYFTADNITKGDRLVRVHSPLADRVEFRDAGPDSKPAMKTLAIRPGDTDFTEGRPHLLLKGLKGPLELGRSYEMTLFFEKGGPLQVQVSVGAH